MSAIDASATKNDVPALQEALASDKPADAAHVDSSLCPPGRRATPSSRCQKLLRWRRRPRATGCGSRAGQRGRAGRARYVRRPARLAERRASAPAAIRSLRVLTGQKIDFAPEGKPEDRAKTVADWKQWISAIGSDRQARRCRSPIRPCLLGRTLLVSQAPQSKIIELDHENKKRLGAGSCPGRPGAARACPTAIGSSQSMPRAW